MNEIMSRKIEQFEKQVKNDVNKNQDEKNKLQKQIDR